MSFTKRLLGSWQKKDALAYALLPLSAVYAAAFHLKKAAYAIGLMSSYRAPLPVIVVGNLTVGGTGKTPLVISLVEHLRASGYTPGLISRGYAGEAAQYPLLLATDTPVGESGDEPALILRRTGAPMAVGPDRQASIELLLANADVDIIVSDDGLQHFALKRDVEIAVVDDTNDSDNSFLLPAGPYREPQTRLASVDLVLHHLAAEPSGAELNTMVLQAGKIRPVTQTTPAEMPAGPMHAVAGIGNPERFFKSCEQLGLTIERHAFADHHQYQISDFEFAGEQPILMTEKDAVKCTELPHNKLWYLPVNAKLNSVFLDRLDKRLATLRDSKND